MGTAYCLIIDLRSFTNLETSNLFKMFLPTSNESTLPKKNRKSKLTIWLALGMMEWIPIISTYDSIPAFPRAIQQFSSSLSKLIQVDSSSPPSRSVAYRIRPATNRCGVKTSTGKHNRNHCELGSPMDFNKDSLSEFCGAKNISDLRYSTSWIHACIHTYKYACNQT